MLKNIKDFSYFLPKDLIANEPAKRRDHCRLLVVNRQNQKIEHKYFYDLVDLLTDNDVLVLNQSKVFPARIYGHKKTGGKFEILLIHQISSDTWLSISRPLLKPNQELEFDFNLTGQVVESDPTTGQIKIKFNFKNNEFFKIIDKIGIFPLPPYIKSTASQKLIRQQYQSVFAKKTGSAAAPTAGLHFTQELLEKLKSKGVQIEYITLHVGLGTFQPLRSDNLKTGKLHSEFYEISPATAKRLNLAKKLGKNIIAVGTTSVRTLESAVLKSPESNNLMSGNDTTELFIHPPYKFNFVDSIITNFHLPESSLLMLITALASFPNCPHNFESYSKSIISQAYKISVEEKYRFFSFGDAMWIRD